MQRWYIKAGFIALGTIAVVHYTIFLPSLEQHREKSLQVDENFPYLLHTPGCQLPNLQVNSHAASKMTVDSGPLSCGRPPMVDSNETHLVLLHSNKRHYEAKKVTCCYRAMWRHNPNVSDNESEWMFDKVKYDFDIRYSEQCYEFNDSVEIHHEFVQVQCKYLDRRKVSKVYTDYHGFFPKRNSFVKSKPDKELNVLILGLDSLSRLNMIRNMPRTYTYILDNLKGIPMFGYNKVGLNTYPNLMPLFAGLSRKGMRDTCLPSDDAHYDKCRFIFKDFAEKGYRTAYMMDRTAVGGLFDYHCYGLVHQPTDYFGETLFIPMESMRHNGICKCVGSRSQIGLLLNYTHKNLRCMTRYNENFFTFSWGVTLSHNGFNDPQQADPLYYNILKDIRQEGILNNTFMIFMSDHGLRFGDFVRSFQGQLEDHLPALFFVVPKWFRKKYQTAMKNLESNTNRLVTAYDLHATLLDLTDLELLKSDVVRKRQNNLKGEIEEKSGISLFLSVPEERTCADAKIPEEFCSCEILEVIDNSVPQVVKAANFMVAHINSNLLRNDDKCIMRSLKSVDKAAVTPRLHIGNDSVIKYQVSFFTEPDDALFSGLVRHFKGDDSIEVIGEISRLNAYGSQSSCMTDVTLLPFCYCKNSEFVHMGVTK